jgi:hypothetical protein
VKQKTPNYINAGDVSVRYIKHKKSSFLLGLVWELKYRRGLEGRKSPSYSKLNKKGILASTIPSGFVTPKLAIRVCVPILSMYA